MPAFDCNRCGACCRSIGTVEELAGYHAGDGVCMHLTAENTCLIYDDRPTVCRVDESCPPSVPLAEWQAANGAECEKLRLRVYGQ